MHNNNRKSVLSNLSFQMLFVLTVAINILIFFYLKRLLPSLTSELHFSLIATTLVVSIVFLMFIYLNSRITSIIVNQDNVSYTTDKKNKLKGMTSHEMQPNNEINSGSVTDISDSVTDNEVQAYRLKSKIYENAKNKQSQQDSNNDHNISDVFSNNLDYDKKVVASNQAQKFAASLRPIHKLPKKLQHYYWFDINNINHFLIDGISEITNNNFFEQKTLLINFNKQVISDQILINRVIDWLEKNQSLVQKIIIVIPSYSLDTITNIRNIDQISKFGIEKILSLSRLGFRFAIQYQKGVEFDTSTLLSHSIGLVVINHQSHPIDLSAPFSFDELSAVIDNLSNYGIDILADEINDQKTYQTYNDLKLRFVSGLNFSQPIKFQS